MSRLRSKGFLEKSYVTCRDYNAAGTLQAGFPVTTFDDRKSNGEYQTTTDVVIPNFRIRRANGEVFMNPFSVEKTKRLTSFSDFTFGTHSSWGKRNLQGPLACLWSIPPVRPTWFNQRKIDAQGRTVLSAHSKVAAENFMALVTVAEAAKTASMIARPFGQATDLINRIVNRKLTLLKKGLTLAAASASAWNEYRFGWKPVLYDLQGIREAYVNNLVQHSKPVRIVARASDREIVWDSLNNITDSTRTYTTNVRMRGNYSHRATVSSGVLYELHDETLESATARRMGLRLSDVPASLWELVPYSFVVDRFLDVGMWLSAIVPKPGVKVLGSWTTTLDYQLNFHTIVEAKIVVSTSPATTYTQSGGEYTEVIQSISRVVNPAIPPLPTVNYRDLSLVQQIDHLALITSRLLGLKTRS